MVIHSLADPVPGLGIAVPVFMPVVITAIVAMILSREDSAPLSLTSIRCAAWGRRSRQLAVRELLTAYS